MEKVTLEMIFPARMACGRRDEEVYPKPAQYERRHTKINNWPDAGKVVKVLDRMH